MRAALDISRNQPPEIVFRGQFSHNQGRRLLPEAPLPEKARGSGATVVAGPRGYRCLDTGASRGEWRHRFQPAAWTAGQEREEPPLVPPFPAGRCPGLGARPGHGHAWHGGKPPRWPPAAGDPREEHRPRLGTSLISLPGGAERVFTPVPRGNSAFQEENFPSN